MFEQLIWLVSGLALLTWGAEWLVIGGSRFAKALGVSSLVIGLTIVAFGTSTPELFVNINSMLAGQDDIALGNIVGSNIFNVLFILGVCALIKPLLVVSKLIKVDVPIMIGVSILLYLFCLDLNISVIEGWVLLFLIFLYTWGSFHVDRRELSFVSDQDTSESKSTGGRNIFFKDMFINGCLILLGLLMLMAGAKLLVHSSVVIARHFGVSELVIALTIVAAGTSLPEVATSIMATIKNERDIAIGNIVGSNIFNILAILGVSGVISNQGMTINADSMKLDIPFMVLVAVSCYPIFRSGGIISRKEGFVFLMSYILYTIYLIKFRH